MSSNPWKLEVSHHALEFVSGEYNRLEAFREGLGLRFYEKLEETFERVKSGPLAFEMKTEIYRRALVNVSKRLQYAVYFRIGDVYVYVDLILPSSIDPALHPSD